MACYVVAVLFANIGSSFLASFDLWANHGNASVIVTFPKSASMRWDVEGFTPIRRVACLIIVIEARQQFETTWIEMKLKTNCKQNNVFLRCGGVPFTYCDVRMRNSEYSHLKSVCYLCRIGFRKSFQVTVKYIWNTFLCGMPNKSPINKQSRNRIACIVTY